MVGHAGGRIWNRLPPRAMVIGKIGETEYTLNWLPLGGFVKIYGEDGGG